MDNKELVNVFTFTKQRYLDLELFSFFFKLHIIRVPLYIQYKYDTMFLRNVLVIDEGHSEVL